MSHRPRLSEGRWIALAAALLLVPAIIIAFSARSPSGGNDPGHNAAGHDSGEAALDVEALGMEHVHGLGVNPADGQLFAATHFGVFAVSERGTATRVGKVQDTMGFTITGPDTFLGSGHPDFAEDDEPLLGLIESTDAGRTWTSLSLRGEADFHALREAHGRVWGYDSTSGTLMSTTDRKQWQRLSQLPMRDFAVSPQSSDVLVATTDRGPVRSDDGGRSWQRLVNAPELVVLAWPREDLLYGVDVAGGVHVSADGGSTWSAAGQAGGAPEALVATDTQPLNVFVAVADVGIVRSADGGQSFTDLYRQQ